MYKNDRRVLSILALIPVIVLVIFLISLRKGFDASAPQGFAPYTGWHALLTREFRAVSSDGVVYRVRREANEPVAELSFWKEALKKRMLDAGYVFVADSSVKAGTTTGYLLELAAPMGAQDYSYLVAAFVDGKHIIVVESAGEVTRLAKHKADIVKAMEALSL
jgi:hypothetical protein